MASSTRGGIRLTILALAIAVQACQLFPGAAPAPDEGSVQLIRGGAVVKAKNREVRLRTPDGRDIAGLRVRVGGKEVALADGKLDFPAGAGTPIVLVPGYLPVRLDAGKAAAEVVLVPVTPLAGAADLVASQGQLAAPDGSVSLRFPAPLTGTTPGAAAAATLGTYRPQLAGAGAGTQRPALGGGCETPLPCPPPLHALGLYVDAAFPLTPGPLAVTFDLRALAARDEAAAAAASRIRQTFANIDATGDPSYRARLASEYGLVLEGDRLTMTVRVGDNGTSDGYTRLEVEGSSLIGVALEVTIASVARPPAGPGASPAPGPTPAPGATSGSGGPGPLGATATPAVALPGLGALPPAIAPRVTAAIDAVDFPADALSTLLSDAGGGLLSDAGGGLLSDAGGGVVANGGGAFTGEFRAPFEPKLAKYHLLTYLDYPWPELAEVRPLTQGGTPILPWARTDWQSRFRAEPLPDTNPVVHLEAQAGPYRLHALGQAPGAGGGDADVNAATTAMADLALDEIASQAGSLQDVYWPAYLAEVAFMKAELDQAGAEAIVQEGIPAGAARARAIFGARGVRPKTIPFADVTTVAGSGAQGTTDGAGALARFDRPNGVARDGAGNLYVADRNNHAIRKITFSGGTATVSTLVANGAGYADGPIASATIKWPRGLDWAGGKLYVTDGTYRVRVIDLAAGVVSTLAGDGTPGNRDGAGAVARFDVPRDVAVAADGTAYVADGYNNAIRKITPGGVVSTLAGGGAAGKADGLGAVARFADPYGLCLGPTGDLFVADRYNHAVRRVTPAGQVTTVVGMPGPGFVNGPVAIARILGPAGIEADAAGNLYVTELFQHRVRRIGLAMANPRVTTVAGGNGAGRTDGVGLRAKFNLPRGLALDGAGGLWVADASNDMVRRIDLTGQPQ